MAVSRLRINMAIWFGTALLIGLALLDTGLYLYLRHNADAVFSSALRQAAAEVAGAIETEIEEGAPIPLAAMAAEVLDEWPRSDLAYAVFNDAPGRLAWRGSAAMSRAFDAALAAGAGGVQSRTFDDPAAGVRFVSTQSTASPTFFVAAGAPTSLLVEQERALGAWLFASLPVLVLFSMFAGYLFSSRALLPLREVTRTIDGIGPANLADRLPVRQPVDEIGELSTRFNELLGRLQAAQESSRRFLGEVAHQIKTPLTLVKGEASLVLDRSRPAVEYEQALRRIGRAADQITYRVQDLLLLAEARLSSSPAADDIVELDSLVVECAELMGRRARHEGRRLEIRRVEPVEAAGNAQLLQEALVELIENAVRHGSVDAAIEISAFREGDNACLSVASAGEPFTLAVKGREPGQDAAADPTAGGGLGLSIVGWIAGVHGGQIHHRREQRRNVVSLCWPAAGRGSGSKGDEID